MSSVRCLHARQRLQTDDLGRSKIHDRLIVGKDTPFAQRLVDIANGLDSVGDRCAHPLLERAVARLGVISLAWYSAKSAFWRSMAAPVPSMPCTTPPMVTCGTIMLPSHSNGRAIAARTLSAVLRSVAWSRQSSTSTANSSPPRRNAVAACPSARKRSRDFLDDRVADQMAHRVVDGLQIVDVGEQQPESLPRAVEPCLEEFIEPAPVRQSRQMVVVGEPIVALLDLVLLDGDGAEMDAGRDDQPFQVARSPFCPIVEGKCRKHLPVPRLDRARPARHQPERQDRRPRRVPIADRWRCRSPRPARPDRRQFRMTRAGPDRRCRRWTWNIRAEGWAPRDCEGSPSWSTVRIEQIAVGASASARWHRSTCY